MFITMFTDISVITAIRLGAFAVWAKESGQTFRYAAVFHTPMQDSNVAEVCGIVNGLHHVIRHFQPPKGSKILAQSDSQTAIDVLEGANRNPLFDGLVERREQILKDKGIMVLYRHVHGHKGTRTPRNAVNTWCDQACREALRIHQAQS